MIRRIRELQTIAVQAGIGVQYNRALHQLVTKLRQDPFACGEPLYRLSALRMQIRHAALRPLFMHYAVCEDRPLVFIKGVALMFPSG